jgi:glycosyltransferase involved in cell wall biosynthesis
LKPRIVQVCTGFPPERKGGVENIVRQITNGLSSDWDTRVVTRFWRFRLNDDRVLQVQTPRREALGYLVWGLKATKRVVDLKPAIIHCHGLEGAIICSILRFFPIKIVMHLHNSLSREQAFYTKASHKIGLRILKIACKAADAVICPTEATRWDLLNHLPELATKSVVVPNFANKPEPWNAERLQELKSNLGIGSERIILYFGKVKRTKGIEELCQAVQSLRPKDHVQLVVAGSATYTERFLNYLKDRYSDVIFTGYVKDPAPFYQLADIFCIYTAGFDGGETFAISLAEAMRSKVPVVCADNPIFREVTGGHAVFVPPHRPQELSEALQKLLNDPNRKEMVDLAFERAEKEFAEAVFCQRISAVYRRLLARKVSSAERL